MINPDNNIKMNKIMNAINEVKMLAAQKGLTLTYLAEYLSKHTNKKYSLDSLSFLNSLVIDTIIDVN